MTRRPRHGDRGPDRRAGGPRPRRGRARRSGEAGARPRAGPEHSNADADRRRGPDHRPGRRDRPGRDRVRRPRKPRPRYRPLPPCRPSRRPPRRWPMARRPSRERRRRRRRSRQPCRPNPSARPRSRKPRRTRSTSDRWPRRRRARAGRPWRRAPPNRRPRPPTPRRPTSRRPRSPRRSRAASLPPAPRRDMPVAANSNQGQPQFRVIKADASAAALDATALAGAREDRANAQSSADQVVASLTSIDSPRRTAALYHKVADAARPGADAPTPADQVSIRLLHAVADGKRAIQMHLHPAELGSIDVKMQWQGDKLTAQFTVDRPETLQILQREVPGARAQPRPGRRQRRQRQPVVLAAPAAGQRQEQRRGLRSGRGQCGLRRRRRAGDRRRAARPGDPRRHSQHPRVGQDGPHGHRLDPQQRASRRRDRHRQHGRKQGDHRLQLVPDAADRPAQVPGPAGAARRHPVRQPAQPVLLGRAGHRRQPEAGHDHQVAGRQLDDGRRRPHRPQGRTGRRRRRAAATAAPASPTRSPRTPPRPASSSATPPATSSAPWRSTTAPASTA